MSGQGGAVGVGGSCLVGEELTSFFGSPLLEPIVRLSYTSAVTPFFWNHAAICGASRSLGMLNCLPGFSSFLNGYVRGTNAPQVMTTAGLSVMEAG